MCCMHVNHCSVMILEMLGMICGVMCLSVESNKHLNQCSCIGEHGVVLWANLCVSA